jgi:hypothetical protein
MDYDSIYCGFTIDGKIKKMFQSTKQSSTLPAFTDLPKATPSNLGWPNWLGITKTWTLVI